MSDEMDFDWNDLGEDRLLPIGHWVVKNSGVLYKENADKSDMVGFFYNPVKPLKDVDQKALKALGDYNYTLDEIPYFKFVDRKRDWVEVFNHLTKHEGFELPDGTAKATFKDGSIKKALDGTMVVAKLGYRNDRKNEAGEAIEENTIEAVFELNEFDQ